MNLWLSIMLTLFDFTPQTSPYTWQVVDDVVMGGRSQGEFYVNEAGHGIFQGHVSLENNGGFSSVRHRFAQTPVAKYDSVELRIKGDGRAYQFRLKSKPSESHSYIYHFQTTGDWQIIRFPFSEMYPAFRGSRLSIPNFPGKTIGEAAFLISNKEEQDFELQIDYIALK